MSGRVIYKRGPKREKKKVELRQVAVKSRRGVRQSGRSGEISVFPLTLLIMDVPRFRVVYPT